MSEAPKPLWKWHTELPWKVPVANVFRVIAVDEHDEPVRCVVEDTAPEDVFCGVKQIGWGDFYDCPSDQEYYGREAAANAAYIVHACNSYPQLVAEVRKLRKWTKLKDDLLKKQVSELKRQDDKLAELENPCVWTPHVSGTFFTSCGDKWNTSSWDINKSILPDYYNHCPLCGHRITEEPTE